MNQGPKIAACLIVKNSAETIERCLASIAPHVDYICVYDTGSTDNTLEILDALGANPPGPGWAELSVRSYQKGDEIWYGEGWNPETGESYYFDGSLHPDLLNFSAARTISFAMAPDDADWFLWLDDDDEFIGGENLRIAAWQCPPESDGFTMMYEYAHDEAGNCVCQLWRERLIRRRAEFVWKDPIHEVYLPDNRPPRLLAIPPDQMRYKHHRPEDRYPRTRNLDILETARQKSIDAEEIPSPRVIAYIGTELMSHGKPEEAISHLQAYLDHPEGTHGDERAQVHHKLATCLRLVGNPQAALEVEFRSLRDRDDWAETAIGLMESFAMLGDWQRVERWAKRALEQGMPESMLILNPLEFSMLPMFRLAEACMNTGRMADAVRWIERAKVVAPGNPMIEERIGALQHLAFAQEAVETVLKARETLVRFDENAKALSVLNNVPYFIKDDARIVRALWEQREMCAHLVRPEEYERWYRDEPKESTVPDEWVENAGDHMPRARYLLEGLQAQEEELGRKPVAIDMGCNDHWLGCYLWTQGYRCDGVELNRSAYEIGCQRSLRFGADVAIWNMNLLETSGLAPNYDAVSMYEVIEHVIDVDEALDACERLIRPGGRVYLSTPDGAFDNGNPARGWNTVERKGHLRCLPANDLCEIVMRRGEIKTAHIDDGTGLVTISYEPKPRKGSIAFYLGPAVESFAVHDMKTRGLGGSETAAIHAATQLAAAGYFVEVYADTTKPGYMAGVLWKRHDAFDPGVERDAVIVSRMPHAFDMPLNAPVRALWCHDAVYPNLTEGRAEKVTHLVVLSDWQRDTFAKLYPFAEDKLTIIRNGISEKLLNEEPPSFEERYPRVVYSSSPDRGLDVLLHYWPQIRARVPDAELHAYYGFDIFDRVAMRDAGRMRFKLELMSKVADLGGEDAGIYLHGRVPQQVLAEGMRKARVWGYPTYFTETSCIGAMEARAAGLPIVTTALGALNETASTGILIRQGVNGNQAEPLDDAYGERFVHHVCALLTNEHEWANWSLRGLDGIAECTWAKRAEDWLALVEAKVAV